MLFRSVAGFVGEPSKYRSSPSEQFLFVNERHVESRYLSHAVKKAYGERLPDKAYPFFALFLDMDPQRVDVNVHPAKAEVKFDDESGVYGFLTSAVRRALRAANVTPEFSGDDTEQPGEASSDDTFPSSGSPTSFQPRPSSGSSGGSRSGSSGGGSRGSGNGASASGGPARSSSPPRSRSTGGPSAGGASPGEQSEALYGQPPSDSETDASGPAQGKSTSADGSDSAGRRPLWSVHDTYLLTPTNEGLLMVDQRAAHIRVLYEHALRRVRNQQGDSQQLLFPHTIDLQPSQVDLLDELMPDLRALGFDLERLSGRTVAVRGVPVDVREGDERTILKDLLTKYTTQERVEDERRKHLAKTIAQQSAVQRGQPLSDAERRGLMNDLFRCEMPYADPSGNPTLVRLSLDELGSLF